MGNPFLLHDSLAQAYHWSHEQISRRTLPQLIMYNHAAHVNHERAERRYEATKGADGRKRSSSPYAADDPLVGGKPISKLSDSELDRYFMGFSTAFN